MNKLQQYAAAQPVTDPWPTIEIPKSVKPLPRLTIWQLIRALLPLFALVAIASADTIITDLWGHEIGRLPWPREHDVYIQVPIGGELPFVPRLATPAPAPPTPRYVGR